MHCIWFSLPLKRFIFIHFSALLRIVCLKCLNGLFLKITIKENNIYLLFTFHCCQWVHLILLLLLSDVCYWYSRSMFDIIIHFKLNLFDVSYIVYHYAIVSIPRYTICVSCLHFCRHFFQLQRLYFHCALYITVVLVSLDILKNEICQWKFNILYGIFLYSIIQYFYS